jgi:type IV/VI secretion system ImpK/VasF family protein
MKEYGETYLLAPFRDFYAEVIRLKALAQRGAGDAGAWGVGAETGAQASGAGDYFAGLLPGEDALAPGAWDLPGAGRLPWDTSKRKGNGARLPSPAETSLAVTSEVKGSTYIWRRLVALIEGYGSGPAGGHGTQYREMQYVMAGLADEIFLTVEPRDGQDWEGHGFWLSNLIESRLFDTHIAGELFFRRLDHLLAERDPADRPLGAVYLMALSLGFRGKYLPGKGRANANLEHDRLTLETYRRQLFHWVFRCEPELDEESHRLFPEAYGDNLREKTKQRLASARSWVILLCAVVLAYVTLTHGIWIKLTGQLFVDHHDIESQVEDLGHKR